MSFMPIYLLLTFKILFFVGLAGIMFDSPFLSDGSEPLRGTILTYASIIIIALTLLYFVLALGWEIKVSTKKKKTKRQIMWSKLKGFKHKIVEDSRNKARQDKLSRLFDKSKIASISTKSRSGSSVSSNLGKVLSHNRENILGREDSKTQHSSDKNDKIDKVDHALEADFTPGSTILTDMSSSDSADISAYSASSSSEEEYSSSSISTATSSVVSTSASSDETPIIHGDVRSDSGASDDSVSIASGSENSGNLVETSEFVLPTSVEGEKEEQKISSEEEAVSTSSSEEESYTSGITETSNNAVDDEKSKNIVIDQQKLQINAESLEVVDDLVSSSGEEDAMNGDERGEDSLEGFVYDDETRVEKRIRKLSIASIASIENDEKMFAQKSDSSDESDDSSSMSDSSTEKQRKSAKRRMQLEENDSDLEVFD